MMPREDDIIHLFYNQHIRRFVDEWGDIVHNPHQYVSPNELYLFHANGGALMTLEKPGRIVQIMTDDYISNHLYLNYGELGPCHNMG